MRSNAAVADACRPCSGGRGRAAGGIGRRPTRGSARTSRPGDRAPAAPSTAAGPARSRRRNASRTVLVPRDRFGDRRRPRPRRARPPWAPRPPRPTRRPARSASSASARPTGTGGTAVGSAPPDSMHVVGERIHGACVLEDRAHQPVRRQQSGSSVNPIARAIGGLQLERGARPLRLPAALAGAARCARGSGTPRPPPARVRSALRSSPSSSSGRPRTALEPAATTWMSRNPPPPSFSSGSSR